MKTKIHHDEKISKEILEKIQQKLSEKENGRNIEIPIYNQIHQANVCVVCDRFIIGTAKLHWIFKQTLLQHKRWFQIPNLSSGLQRSYQVSDPDLQELLLSPRERVKINGEYLCCSQGYRALQNDKFWKTIHRNMLYPTTLPLEHYQQI
jgi:hypothetical protein